VLLIGRLLAAKAPRKARAFLQAGLIASGLVVLTALPVVFAFGRSPGNPSVLPNNYIAGLASVLALLWSLMALFALSSRRS
jgi:hypothetical protein